MPVENQFTDLNANGITIRPAFGCKLSKGTLIVFVISSPLPKVSWN